MVKKGDSLFNLAQKFAIQNKLGEKKMNKVYEILQEMYKQYTIEGKVNDMN